MLFQAGIWGGGGKGRAVLVGSTSDLQLSTKLVNRPVPRSDCKCTIVREWVCVRGGRGGSGAISPVSPAQIHT